jgi:hypothetical protein
MQERMLLPMIFVTASTARLTHGNMRNVTFHTVGG